MGVRMKKPSSNHRGSAPVPPSNERQAFRPMPAALREEVVGLLAKILVEDYKQLQGVNRPTVKTPTVSNRGLRLVKAVEKAGRSS
jgi:hypothetical protein